MIKGWKRRGKIEFKKPIILQNEKEEDINILIIPYINDPSENAFIYQPGKIINCHVKEIIMEVRLVVNDDDRYLLHDDDRGSLDSIIEEYKTTTLRKKRRTTKHLWGRNLQFLVSNQAGTMRELTVQSQVRLSLLDPVFSLMAKEDILVEEEQ